MAKVIKYKQRGKISTRLVDGEAFLITRTTIKHLNVTATAIWLVLEQPTTQRDICSLLHTLFPDQEKATIRRDVAATLKQFRAEGIVSIHH